MNIGFLQSSSLGIQSDSQMIIRVTHHFLSIVFRFQYHSQKVIGSLGLSNGIATKSCLLVL